MTGQETRPSKRYVLDLARWVNGSQCISFVLSVLLASSLLLESFDENDDGALAELILIRPGQLRTTRPLVRTLFMSLTGWMLLLSACRFIEQEKLPGSISFTRSIQWCFRTPHLWKRLPRLSICIRIFPSYRHVYGHKVSVIFRKVITEMTKKRNEVGGGEGNLIVMPNWETRGDAVYLSITWNGRRTGNFISRLKKNSSLRKNCRSQTEVNFLIWGHDLHSGKIHLIGLVSFVSRACPFK